uniref:zinc finger protein 678-like isoform X1 n=1 Tax=Semicossyphus pulcher TaxID=241346 RepID=UPI0037E97164
MSGFQDLKDLFRRRLLAAVIGDEAGQTSTCGYEEELHRQRKLLDVILTPEIKLRRADVQQLLLSKEELQPEQQEWSPSLNQEDTETPHIKEEQEELWISQEGEQLQGLEEADTNKFPFTIVTVKSEDDEEKPQSSQLHQRQTEQMETGADGEDCGGAEPARNSDPERHLQPETEVKTEDSSEPETEDSDDYWKETREHQSGLNSVNFKDKRPETDKKSHSCSECGKTFKDKPYLNIHMRIHTGDKPFNCSVCGKRFNRKGILTNHMLVHTGEKPFSCPECGKRFTQKSYLTLHMAYHRGDKRYSCSVCDKRFFWFYQLKKHKCVGGQASELHQNQNEKKREAESGADGEDCGGAEPARNSDPERHLQPETEVKTEDSSEPETNDGVDDWKETREHQSGLNSVENLKDKRPETDIKSHSCSECGKTFKAEQDLIIHMRIHTDKKPFSCSVCCKRFTHKGILTKHLVIHSGEKPFSCSVCGKRFRQKEHLIRHSTVHSGEKPFSCSECGKRFTQKSYLTLHMAHHRGEKRCRCSVCGKTFLWYNQLKKHKCAGSQASELHQNQSEEKTEAETGADGEDCGGAEPARNSDPERHLQPETEVKTEDSSEPETEDSEDDWKETREHQSGLNSVKNFDNKRPKNNKKSHSCSECGKTFNKKRNMTRHMIIHTGDKPFSCSECGKRFTSKPFLKLHLANHRGEKPFSCSECGKRFSWHHQLKKHKCAGSQASELHQNQTEDKRQAETGADGEDCGGPEPVRNSDPERHLQPETEVKTEDSSEPETEDRDYEKSVRLNYEKC